MELGKLGHATMRGAIAAMAMTGMRQVTVGLGLIEETPPRAIFRQKAKGLIRRVPRTNRRAAIELAHWGYGAGAGAAYGALPEGLRQTRWSGLVYGLAIWASFEAGVAPVLGLEQAKRPRPIERLAFAADHLLYGFVLSEMHKRPRE
jgi:hypothetical protein